MPGLVGAAGAAVEQTAAVTGRARHGRALLTRRTARAPGADALTGGSETHGESA